jgi:hypothetical protein
MAAVPNKNSGTAWFWSCFATMVLCAGICTVAVFFPKYTKWEILANHPAKDIENDIYQLLESRKACVMEELNVAISVKRVEKRKLICPTIEIGKTPGRPSVRVIAEEAEIVGDDAKKLLDITCRNGECTVDDKFKVRFPGSQVYSISVNNGK